MAAMLRREKRSTAGKRMSDLTGKALEDDEAFWNHDTWRDDDADNDSANESFHSSDEDSEHAKDEFDSDFDDSESDHEQEEVDAGLQQERLLVKQERKEQHHAQRQYRDVASTKKSIQKQHQLKKPAARSSPTMGSATGGGRWGSGIGSVKRVMGEGINAGIALNVPCQFLFARKAPPAPMAPTTISAAVTGISLSMPAGSVTPQIAINAQASTSVGIESSGAAASATVAPISVRSGEAAYIPSSMSLAADGPTAASPSSSAQLSSQLQTSYPTSAATASQTPRKTASKSLSKFRSHHAGGASSGRSAIAATRPRRASMLQSIYSSHYRTAKQEGVSATPSALGASAHSHSATTPLSSVALSSPTPSSSRKRPRRSQEEMLLEAATITEPENERWLLSRQRNLQNHQAGTAGLTESKNGGVSRHSASSKANMILVEKYLSRRGYPNTINFPEMDFVPAILRSTRRSTADSVSVTRTSYAASAWLCVITGRPAQYRDPITSLPFADAAAFRELCRRQAAGESLDDPVPIPWPRSNDDTILRQNAILPTETSLSPATSTATIHKITSNGGAMLSTMASVSIAPSHSEGVDVAMTNSDGETVSSARPKGNNIEGANHCSSDHNFSQSTLDDPNRRSSESEHHSRMGHVTLSDSHHQDGLAQINCVAANAGLTVYTTASEQNQVYGYQQANPALVPIDCEPAEVYQHPPIGQPRDNGIVAGDCVVKQKDSAPAAFKRPFGEDRWPPHLSTTLNVVDSAINPSKTLVSTPPVPDAQAIRFDKALLAPGRSDAHTTPNSITGSVVPAAAGMDAVGGSTTAKSCTANASQKKASSISSAVETATIKRSSPRHRKPSVKLVESIETWEKRSSHGSSNGSVGSSAKAELSSSQYADAGRNNGSKQLVELSEATPRRVGLDVPNASPRQASAVQDKTNPESRENDFEAHQLEQQQ